MWRCKKPHERRLPALSCPSRCAGVFSSSWRYRGAESRATSAKAWGRDRRSARTLYRCLGDQETARLRHSQEGAGQGWQPYPWNMSSRVIPWVRSGKQWLFEWTTAPRQRNKLFYAWGFLWSTLLSKQSHSCCDAHCRAYGQKLGVFKLGKLMTGNIHRNDKSIHVWMEVHVQPM